MMETTMSRFSTNELIRARRESINSHFETHIRNRWTILRRMVLFPISTSKSKPGFEAPIGSKSDLKTSSKQTNLILWIYVSFWILCDAQKIENVIFIMQQKIKDLYIREILLLYLLTNELIRAHQERINSHF